MGVDEPNPELSALAEATITAAAILVPAFWDAGLRLPEPEDFDTPDLSELWTAVLDAHKRGPVTKISVQRELRELGWDEHKSFAALHKVQASYVTLPEAVEASDVLMSRRLRRQARSVCGETLKELASAVDVEDVVRRHEIRIVDVASRADGADGWLTGDDVREERLERIETGIKDFDRVNGGLPSGVLTIVAARPGMGKSAFATAILRNVAKRGLGVGCNSLEMPALDLIHRAAAAEAYDPSVFNPDEPGGDTNPYYSDYERRLLHGEMLERFENAKARIKRLPILWDEKQGRTIGQIRMGGRRLRSKFGRQAIDLRLLVVDHLGKVHADRNRDSRHLELGDVSDGLMGLASELRIPVVALAQLNRDVEKRPDKRPMVQDLRESGRLEEDAHTIVTLYRQAYYDDLARERQEEIDEDRATDSRHVIEANTVKSRGGRLKLVKLFCDIGANAIMDKADSVAHVRRQQQAELFR